MGCVAAHAVMVAVVILVFDEGFDQVTALLERCRCIRTAGPDNRLRLRLGNRLQTGLGCLLLEDMCQTHLHGEISRIGLNDAVRGADMDSTH